MLWAKVTLSSVLHRSREPGKKEHFGCEKNLGHWELEVTWVHSISLPQPCNKSSARIDGLSMLKWRLTCHTTVAKDNGCILDIADALRIT